MKGVYKLLRTTSHVSERKVFQINKCEGKLTSLLEIERPVGGDIWDY